MNNAVGYARPARLENTVALGTDGIGGDMLEEFRIAYVRHREDDVTATPSAAWSWLEAGSGLVPEAADDRVRWSYEPIDPWHLAFTPRRAAARGRRSRRGRAQETAARRGSTRSRCAPGRTSRPSGSGHGSEPGTGLCPAPRAAQAVQSAKASIMACTSAPSG